MNRRSLLLATPALLAAPSVLRAQGAFPDKPIRLIIPWPPGQATDLAGRLCAEKMAQHLGVAIVPENRAGAGGQIGTDAVAKAAPDGYTLLAASAGPVSVSPLVQRTAYDPERDLIPIAMAGNSPYILVVRPNFPAQDLLSFIREVKSKPGRYSFGSSGTGAAAHLINEWFNRQAGIEALHVPFSGSTPSLTAVVAGQVDYTLETLAATAPLFRQGALRALGTSFENGTYLAPEIPSIAKVANMPGYNVGAWIGIMAPARTPAPVVQRLAAAMDAAMRTPDIQERFAGISVEKDYRNTAAFAAHLQAMKAKFGEVVRTANIRAE